MNKILIMILLAATVLIAACTTGEMLPVNQTTQIPNPASKYCVDNGGTLEIKTATDGSQAGFCTLTDGAVCEEWAFMRGECGSDTPDECVNLTADACGKNVNCVQNFGGPSTCSGNLCTDDVKYLGCQRKIIPGKLQAFDCPIERTQACTREYMPVCGQVQVQCIRAPCPPIKQTFSNKCTACANSLTISYTEGACQDNLAGGTVLAGNNSEQCKNVGGSWTGFDCEGITAEQCQEIGGAFNECESACRNDPNAQVCTLQCVQVCRFV